MRGGKRTSKTTRLYWNSVGEVNRGIVNDWTCGRRGRGGGERVGPGGGVDEEGKEGDAKRDDDGDGDQKTRSAAPPGVASMRVGKRHG